MFLERRDYYRSCSSLEFFLKICFFSQLTPRHPTSWLTSSKEVPNLQASKCGGGIIHSCIYRCFPFWNLMFTLWPCIPSTYNRYYQNASPWARGAFRRRKCPFQPVNGFEAGWCVTCADDNTVAKLVLQSRNVCVCVCVYIFMYILVYTSTCDIYLDTCVCTVCKYEIRAQQNPLEINQANE